MDRAVPSPSLDAPRYRRLKAIASGGMGSVDLCLRIEGEFQRLVAVKRLLPLLRVDESVRAMFLDEARIAGLLRHPNVVSVTDVGEDEDGPFLVMDYVEGLSLHAMRAQLTERMPPGVAARIVLDCARGLHAAHELRGHDGTWLGLVHRDVSPHNVLVSFDGHVLLTDFGISKAVGRQTRTSTGMIKGKLGYMAPEQLRFEEADRRSDVFALGIVFHELLSGARLFEGEPRVIAQNILNGKVARIRDLQPSVPEALAELAERMLAMRPEARPATADEVATRLDEILRGGAIEPATADVAEFARARFATERQAMGEKVAALIATGTDVSKSVRLELPVTRSEPPDSQTAHTAAATPRAIGARPSWRRPAAWAIAACFVLAPLVMWAIGVAQNEAREPAVTAPAPAEVREPIAAVPSVEAVAAPEEALDVDPAPAPEPPAIAPTSPRRPRDHARPRQGDDPMGRWSWE